MCGIAGIISNKRSESLTHWIPKVWKGLEHRGPDDQGYLIFQRPFVKIQTGNNISEVSTIDGVALLHKRLSILDLSSSGWQPMSTANGRYSIVFNGEIYNYLELRAELEKIGYKFKSNTDTEVLLYSYVHWGTDSLTRFIGMFSFAILDTKTKKLFLARDFFGIKPLYYSFHNNNFAFASELPKMLELPWVDKRANPERIYHYLRYGVTDHGQETLLRDIFQVPAAHFLEISLEKKILPTPIKYWDTTTSEKLDISYKEASSHLRKLFLKNIKLHLRSDVPIGAALSGGTDSSAIVSSMRFLLGKSFPIHSFSYVANNKTLSEEKWVDILADSCDIIKHKVHINPNELTEDLSSLIKVQGEPFTSTSIYAQYRVFQCAEKNNIKVMLDGQGGDEIFGGYRHYLSARLTSMLRQKKWIQSIKFIKTVTALLGKESAEFLIWTAGFFIPPHLQHHLRVLFGREIFPNWLNADWFRQKGVDGTFFHQTFGTQVLSDCLNRDMKLTTIPHLLRYEDRNSMAFSIESRVPFLTPELVNFAFSLPESYIVSQNGIPKSIFKSAMRGLVPDPILDRKDKLGFATPENSWMLALRNWIQDRLNPAFLKELPVFNSQILESSITRALEGKTVSNSQIWRWINFAEWSRIFDITYN